MADPIVSLLTDFGLADPSVAACKGVILTIAPEARLVDVSHSVPAQGILEGAAILWAALPYLPIGTHLAVVDPGVGTARRPIAIQTGRGDYLVGPDNGLLVPAAERLGGIVACHELEAPEYRRETVSATFHGRDVFAPAAAHLARGVGIAALGRVVDPATLIRVGWPEPTVVPRGGSGRGYIEASVAFVDTFGNAQLYATKAELEAAVGPLTPGDLLWIMAADVEPFGDSREQDWVDAAWRTAYGDAEPGEPLVAVDSYGRLSFAVNLESAAERFSVAPGRRLRISRAAAGSANRPGSAPGA